jgi:REP element-mobilizing transposase RayT
VAAELRRALDECCAAAGWEIMELHILPTYVQIKLRAPETLEAAELVRKLKAYTRRSLRLRLPQIAALPSLWRQAYETTQAERVPFDVLDRFVERHFHEPRAYRRSDGGYTTRTYPPFLV